MFHIIIGLFLVALGLEMGLTILGFDITIVPAIGEIMRYAVPLLFIYIGIRMIMSGKEKQKHND